MSLNSSSENYFQKIDTTSVKLSEQQERILKRVLEIIEKNPELNKNLSDAFAQMAKKLLSDPKKFEAFEKLIDEKTERELSVIEDEYEKSLKNGIPKEDAQWIAIEKSKEIIRNSTNLNLEAFKNFLNQN
jgi:hypothetical protein